MKWVFVSGCGEICEEAVLGFFGTNVQAVDGMEWRHQTEARVGHVLTEIETEISGMPARRTAARGNQLDYKTIFD